MAKATYGTGSSVMTPTAAFSADRTAVPSTLAWLTDAPTYAREGNILSSGATLSWMAATLGLPGVAELTALAAEVPDSDGVVLVPAFTGLGAPYWDRDGRAALSGMTTSTTRAHLARAALDCGGAPDLRRRRGDRPTTSRSRSCGPTAVPPRRRC